MFGARCLGEFSVQMDACSTLIPPPPPRNAMKANIFTSAAKCA